MASWIKIFRELLQWEWFDKAEMVQIFIYFLLKANCEDKHWQGMLIRRGQLVTTNSAIRSDLKLSEQTVRTCIKRLVSTGEITYQSTKRYCVITVCNYGRYQEGKTKDTANGQINEQKTVVNDNSTGNCKGVGKKTNEQSTNSQRSINEQSTNRNPKTNEAINKQISIESICVTDDCKKNKDTTKKAINEQSTNNQRQNQCEINDNIRRKNKEEYISKETSLTRGKESTVAIASVPAASDEATASKPDNPKTEKLPAKEIKGLWNTTCVGYPKLVVISDARKNKMRLRISEMGGVEKAMPLIKQVFEKMQQSNFLKGDNRRGWKASFDWLFENDKNWVKVYEGNYDNKTEQKSTSRYNNNKKCNDEWE